MSLRRRITAAVAIGVAAVVFNDNSFGNVKRSQRKFLAEPIATEEPAGDVGAEIEAIGHQRVSRRGKRLRGGGVGSLGRFEGPPVVLCGCGKVAVLIDYPGRSLP